MTFIKQASFPFKTGENYPFYKVDFDYNFSKVRKIINLETYLLLAVDQQFNLHFIQYRDPYPHERLIVPPSFALKGTGNIKFSLEYHTLRAFLYNKRIEDVGFSWYFNDRREPFDNWPDIFYIGQGKLLMKLSSEEPAFVLYYDDRLESEETSGITWLQNGTNIIPVDTYRAILYKRSEKFAVLTCVLSQKVKTLNFTHAQGISDMKVLPKQDIAIGIGIGTDFHKTVEILDLRKNKVIEKTILFGSTEQKVIVDEVDHSGKFIVYGTMTTEGINKVNLRVWRTLLDRTVRSSKKFTVPQTMNPDVIEFLNKDHIIIINKNHAVDICRLDENGILQIYNTTAALGPGYFPEAQPPKADDVSSYSHLKVLDDKTFVAVFARTVSAKTDDVSTNEQRVIVFNYAFESDPERENQVQESEFAGLKCFKQITTKTLINHTPDKVLGITHWEDKFVVFLTQSNKLYHYDLKIGKLSLIVTLDGIELPFVSMEALNDKYVAILFPESQSDRVLVFNVLESALLFDSKTWYVGNLGNKYCLSLGRIFLMYAESHAEVRYGFGEIDPEGSKFKFISDYPERSLLSNLIVTPSLIAIGTSTFRGVINLEVEKIVFYSLEKKSFLYEIHVDTLEPLADPGNRVKKILCIKDNLIAILVVHPTFTDYSEIFLWDIEKQCIVASYYEENIKWMLKISKDHLLYTCTDNGAHFLDISPYIGKYEKKENPDTLEVLCDIWDEFQPLLRSMSTLFPMLPVFVGYDKRIYPNSLLFFRKRTPNVECLRIVHRLIGKLYNPYIMRQVMDMIFKPHTQSTEENKTDIEIGEA